MELCVHRAHLDHGAQDLDPDPGCRYRSGMADSPDASHEPASLVSIDLTGPESPGGTVGRILIGMLLLVIFGVLAVACAIVYFVGDFIPLFAEGWDWVTALAPFAGALFLGLAILGFELLRRGRKARDTDYQTLVTVLEDTGLAEVKTDEGPSSTPPGAPQPPTVV